MPFCDIYQTAVIAGMIVYQVKESIPAVGKNTDIFVINATDAFSYLSRETSRQIDVLAERYLRDLEPHHMRGLLGAVKQIGVTPATMTEDFAAMVAQIKTDIG